MNMFYSDTTKAFYLPTEEHPEDVIEVTDELYRDLSSGRGRTHHIEVIGGLPTLVETPEIPPTFEELSNMNRNIRDQLLSSCDWVVLSDSPLSGNQDWLDYRQTLRDITTQGGFPETVVWPTEPV